MGPAYPTGDVRLRFRAASLAPWGRKESATRPNQGLRPPKNAHQITIPRFCAFSDDLSCVLPRFSPRSGSPGTREQATACSRVIETLSAP